MDKSRFSDVPYLPKDIDAWRHIVDQVSGVVGPNWIVICLEGEAVADMTQAALAGGILR